MLVVVGGHSRNIGKTSVVAGLIRKLPHRNWTAMKVTQYGHGVCSRNGGACDCATGVDHAFALSQEEEPNRNDSGRFLAAGARRSYWLRASAANLACAVPAIRKIVAESENAIVESNSLLQFIDPDLYVVVLDFSREDFKASTLRFMNRADAFVIVDAGINVPLWQDVARGLWDTKPHFPARPPRYVSDELAEFVDERLSMKGGPLKVYR